MEHAINNVIGNRLCEAHLFNECSSEALMRFAQGGVIREYKKGKILFLHDDTAERYYVVNKGWVKLFRETPDGAQVVVDIISAGHVFGESSLFQDGLHQYGAEIIEDAELVSLPIKILHEEIKINHSFALSMIEHMARKQHKNERDIEQLSVQNASQRIGCFLLRLADQTEKGALCIQLPYDKTLIAARLGMQPETFSRALAKLRDGTGIKVNGSVVELESLQVLADYACMACSSEFPCRDLMCKKAK